MIEYKSCFAKSMQDMVDYRVSLGYIAASYENRLKRLGTFIAEKYSGDDNKANGTTLCVSAGQ